jgi:hypothetical protein
LPESHALIDSLKSENTMMFNSVDSLEIKLKEYEDLLRKFSSENLKSMLCIQSDISNKSDLIVDDLSASTSYTFDSELDSIVITHVIVDTACLDNSENSCLNDYEKPKSKESGTQGKFVPTCHYCGNISHIRPNCYLLKSHRPWNKQVAPKKGNIEKPCFDKYVPPYRRHLSQEGKNFVLCKNANLKMQNPSRSSSANKVNLPAINVVSQDTLGHTVIKSGIRSLGSKNKSER